MDGFQTELLDRLPLAQAALRVFGYALASATLQAIFDRHRGRCYQDTLGFEQLVHLIRDALIEHHGSGHRAFSEAQVRGDLPVAEQNVYGKLARIPEALSMALLAGGSARLRKILPPDRPAGSIPDSLVDFQLIAFDGKKIKNAAKRLKPLRGLPGKLLGGKLLVAVDVRSAQAMAMNADPDGERNDVPLVPGLVGQVRQLEARPILWMGDRQFGNLDVPWLCCERPEDHFLLRCVKTLKLAADPQKPGASFLDKENRWVTQTWGWIGALGDRRRRYVRRITLDRPGEEIIILITDLLDADRYPAADLLAAYRLRWGIERVFQEVTEVFNLRTLIGSSPRAMIFQSALCFLLYNMIQVARAYVAEDGDQPIEKVSSEKLFWGVRDQLTTWRTLGDPRVAGQKLAFAGHDHAAEPAAMTKWLQRTLKGCWREQYIKAPQKRTTASSAATVPRARVPAGHGGHASTWRILQAAKAAARHEQRS